MAMILPTSMGGKLSKTLLNFWMLFITISTLTSTFDDDDKVCSANANRWDMNGRVL